MEAKNMTALICAFARAWHSENRKTRIFDDSVARKLITDETYSQIANHMADGIGYFNPQFAGNRDEALAWIVDNQLSPSPLGRSAFAEKALATAARIGAGQYLIFAAGYDTFAYRQPDWAGKMQIFEIDHPTAGKDKQERARGAGLTVPPNVHYIAADFTDEAWLAALARHEAFQPARISFCSLLGLVYYLSRDVFAHTLSAIGSILPGGSSLVFDYPDENSAGEKAEVRVKQQNSLAGAANENVLAAYAYEEMESLMADAGFLIYEHLTPREMTGQYFGEYNRANPDRPITAFGNINYCLAVKQMN